MNTPEILPEPLGPIHASAGRSWASPCTRTRACPHGAVWRSRIQGRAGCAQDVSENSPIRGAVRHTLASSVACAHHLRLKARTRTLSRLLQSGTRPSHIGHLVHDMKSFQAAVDGLHPCIA